MIPTASPSGTSQGRKDLTVTEWTESRNWTESTETYGAKRSAQAECSFQPADWRSLAAILTDGKNRTGLAGSLRSQPSGQPEGGLVLLTSSYTTRFARSWRPANSL